MTVRTDPPTISVILEDTGWGAGGDVNLYGDRIQDGIELTADEADRLARELIAAAAVHRALRERFRR